MMSSRSRSKARRKDKKAIIPTVNQFGEPLPPIGGERVKRRKHIPSKNVKPTAPSAAHDHLLNTSESAGEAYDDVQEVAHDSSLAFQTAGPASSPTHPKQLPRTRSNAFGRDKNEKRKRAEEDALRASIRFDSWHKLVKDLLPILKRTLYSASGTQLPSLDAQHLAQDHFKISCTSRCSVTFRQAIRIYRLDSMRMENLDSCQCRAVLINSMLDASMFPSSPSLPRSAFHFDLLRFYAASRDWSDSNAMSFANTLSRQWDLLLPNDGIRRQLGSASMWFTTAKAYLRDAERNAPRTWTEHRPHYKADPLRLSLDDLVHRCPACFTQFLPRNASTTPDDLEKVPQLIVSIDGNFTHCRQAEPDHVEKNPCPPAYFVSQAQVQEVAASMDRLAKKHSVGALRDQINACSANVKAADERAAKGAFGVCDITGLVGLCCRHDIPLVFCDITSAALIAVVPALKHIGVLYDIGCRFPNKRNIADILRIRVTWAVSVFHVYGHNYRCQVLYSPRRKPGFAWSDGEGMERVWSALADIIAAERLMSHGERHLALEGRLRHIGEGHLIELFDTINKKTHRLHSVAAKARSRLRARHTINTILSLFATIKDAKRVEDGLSKFDCPQHFQFLPRKVAYALTEMAKRRLRHVSRTQDRSGLRPAYTVLAEQLLAKVGSVRSLRDQQRGRTKGLRGQTSVQLLKSAESADRKAALALLPQVVKAVRRRKRAPNEPPFNLFRASWPLPRAAKAFIEGRRDQILELKQLA
ncbi:hypothetical protein OC834_002340 [Tilletia horrida]|nr:hypothetical protein OC834_002340 [Tilletia horrida]